MRLQKHKKMKSVFNISVNQMKALLLCLLFTGFITPIFALSDTCMAVVNKQEFTKSVKKDFGISPYGTVRLHNQYGKMDVKTWEKDRVKIDIRIRVNAVSEAKAQEVFDRISVDFTNSKDYISAESSVNSRNSNWWGSWSGSNDKSDFQIDWEVFMPATVSLDLNNKYGDVYVAELTRNATVEVKYGNFRLEGIGEELEVSLGYGNGTVVKSGKTSAEIHYSKFKLQNCANADFSTKYSKIDVDNATDMRVSSAYDTYNIGSVRDYISEGKYDNISIGTADNITASARYTDFSVGTVNNSAEFDLTYGGARIGTVRRGFSQMRFFGKYADYKVKVEDGASYQLDAAADYAGIRYPSVMKVNYEKDQGSSHQVEGYINTKGARSVIKARLDYGGLKVD